MIYNFLIIILMQSERLLWIHQFGDYSINISGIMMFLAFFFFLFIWYLLNVYYVPCAINIHLWVKQRDYFCDTDFVACAPRNRRLSFPSLLAYIHQRWIVVLSFGSNFSSVMKWKWYFISYTWPSQRLLFTIICM